MPEKIRVFESESQTGKAPKLEIRPKREEPHTDGLFKPVRHQAPLTRDLILRLIELIKQV